MGRSVTTILYGVVYLLVRYTKRSPRKRDDIV
nr:MAG TPA: hypothetical protein [Caudoviricetes sp.]